MFLELREIAKLKCMTKGKQRAENTDGLGP